MPDSSFTVQQRGSMLKHVRMKTSAHDHDVIGLWSVEFRGNPYYANCVVSARYSDIARRWFTNFFQTL